MRLIERGAKRKTSPHVFVSHSSKDKPVARQLAIDLTLCGVDAWLDEWEIRLGQSLPDILADAMEKSHYISILMTENYNTSVWTKAEFKKALMREQKEGRIVMLPLLVSGETIPDFIQDKVYVDFRTKYFEGIVRLVSEIHSISSFRVTQSLSSRPPKSIREVWETLEYCGFKPYALFESADFNEILRLGGRRLGPERASFSPEILLDEGELPPHLRALMERLV